MEATFKLLQTFISAEYGERRTLLHLLRRGSARSEPAAVKTCPFPCPCPWAGALQGCGHCPLLVHVLLQKTQRKAFRTNSMGNPSNSNVETYKPNTFEETSHSSISRIQAHHTSMTTLRRSRQSAVSAVFWDYGKLLSPEIIPMLTQRRSYCSNLQPSA